MKEFPHDHITPFSSEDGKKQQVRAMFDQLAPKYDLLNRLLSAGIDRGWRKKAIKLFLQDQPQILLDVATGTADMALLAAGILQPRKIIGIDISDKMLQIGRNKIGQKSLKTVIELYNGDGETINFKDNSFDGVMVAFGVRNFEHLEKGLAEILRVLKPSGQLVVLEFSKPILPGVKTLYNFYMSKFTPSIAQFFRQNRRAYQYLSESAQAFPDRERFITILNQIGYSVTKCKPLSLGICCIYSGRKPNP
ncbi:MAG: bifunctional demethylmenaquinone methyltransferase/2-methoxy-6-polyprenyl-1,4-benzoquinol methylase UbiE [Flavisolibacter sp.]